MKHRSSSVVVALLMALCDSASAQGFQGLQWGANVAAIKRVFPQVTEERDTGELIAPCDNADGSTYECSVAQRMCQTSGSFCHPSLLLVDYKVGPRRFKVLFSLSSAKTLTSVVLTLTKQLVDEPVSIAEDAYDMLFRSLETKYGPPMSSESPTRSLQRPCNHTAGCVYSGLVSWRTKDTTIHLRTSGSYDRKTMRFVGMPLTPDISITYRPLLGTEELAL